MKPLYLLRSQKSLVPCDLFLAQKKYYSSLVASKLRIANESPLAFNGK